MEACEGKYYAACVLCEKCRQLLTRCQCEADACGNAPAFSRTVPSDLHAELIPSNPQMATTRNTILLRNPHLTKQFVDLPRSGSGRVIQGRNDWLVDSLVTMDDSELRSIYSLSQQESVDQATGRVRSNSTNSIYIRDSIASPDTDRLWKCIALILHNHMKRAGNSLGKGAPRYDVFDQMYPESAPTYTASPIPPTSVKEIQSFLKKLSEKAQLEPECIIMSYVYLEHFLTKTKGSFPLRWYNWSCLMIICVLLASKVWDDLSMWNIDYTKICTFLTIQRLNQLEAVYLTAMCFNVRVAQSVYAEYYFKLNSMMGRVGLPSDSEAIPVKSKNGRRSSMIEVGQTSVKGCLFGSRSTSDCLLALKTRRASVPNASLEELIHSPQSSNSSTSPQMCN